MLSQVALKNGTSFLTLKMGQGRQHLYEHVSLIETIITMQSFKDLACKQQPQQSHQSGFCKGRERINYLS